MKQPVEDRCSNDGIAEDLAPFASRAVGADEHASAFVPAAYKLKEQMRDVRLEGQVTEFVHDQELRLRENVRRYSSLFSAWALASWATSACAGMNDTV